MKNFAAARPGSRSRPPDPCDERKVRRAGLEQDGIEITRPRPDEGGASREVYIDSDNALGSPRGDVDDGFAIAALLASGLPVAALGSTFGNTAETLAFENNRTLASLCGYEGPLLRGAAGPDPVPTEASRFLSAWPGPVRIVALGPLTNIASALESEPSAGARWSEVVAVGSSSTSRGRWPPWWPHEFNLTKDRRAAAIVFESRVPLTLVPLDVARRLSIAQADLDSLPGPLGERLRMGSRRWLLRARVLRLSRSFPVRDLVAALYVLEPSAFDLEIRGARFHPYGWVEYRAGGREVRLIRGFERDRLWRLFLDNVDSSERAHLGARAPLQVRMAEAAPSGPSSQPDASRT